MAHLPSVAGVEVWKARTGFTLIKCLASVGMWLCTHKAKGPFPACIVIALSGVSLVWWPGKQQHPVRGSGFLEVIDTGIHTDNGQQVAIDYDINFK